MGLPWNVNASMGGAGVNDQILRSLRFRSSASAYLNRTPASASNRTTWTWSSWVKRGQLGTTYYVIFSAANGATTRDYISYDNNDRLTFDIADATAGRVTTSAVFRDPSAWYHVMVSVDTTQASSSNRIKIYINGVQQTDLAINSPPSLNYSTGVNNTVVHRIGNAAQAGNAYFDGYMAEVNFIDGQQLTPSSFGYYDPVTGVWQPAPFKGTYGTNGFYLPFTDIATTSGSNFGLGRDYSGNSNYFNTNNISVTAGATYDSMIDSPTNFGDGTGIYNRGNYSTLNPLVRFQPNNSSYSSGNLGMQQTGGASGSHACAISSLSMSSGKWYAEFTDDTATYDGNRFGILNIYNNSNYTNSNPYIGWAVDGYCIYKNSVNAVKENNGVTTTIGSNWSAGAVISIAVDIDNSKIWWRVNGGAWFGGGDPAAGTSPVFTIISGNTYAFATAPYNNNGVTSNFGQRPFAYTPPTGYKALNTFNLPTPTIGNGASYMTATLYTGNGTSQTITNGGNNPIGVTFQPDFVWAKIRSTTGNHSNYDSVRGAQQWISTNLTNAEGTYPGVTAFNSNGFSIGSDGGVNTNAATYVAWQWQAGKGTTSTNTSGSITSTVSVSTQSGFSIVTYTGTGAVATVGHGLGVTPNMIIWKNRSAAENWVVYHSSLGATGNVYLNLTNGFSADSTTQNNTSPTSSVFTVATSGAVNGSAKNIVAYCFAAVRGYSAFGSYTGNASTDGPFIYTDFRPRWLLVKRTNTTENWYLIDSSRNTYNALGELIEPNLSNAGSSTNVVDFLSNGFKVRETGTGFNGSGSTYIYAAFAENPFNISRAR